MFMETDNIELNKPKEIEDALNMIPGVKVTGSHIYPSSKIVIWIKVHKDYSNVLILIGRIMSRNYGGFENYNPYWPDSTDDDWVYGSGWRCMLDYTDDEKTILDGNILFCIESGSYGGDVAIEQSKKIADNIKWHLEHKNFCNAFGITEIIRDDKINEILEFRNKQIEEII